MMRDSIIISPICRRWALDNGHRDQLDTAKALMDAYRQWKLENGKDLSLYATPSDVLEKRAASARAKLERYQRVLDSRR